MGGCGNGGKQEGGQDSQGRPHGVVATHYYRARRTASAPAARMRSTSRSKSGRVAAGPARTRNSGLPFAAPSVTITPSIPAARSRAGERLGVLAAAEGAGLGVVGGGWRRRRGDRCSIAGRQALDFDARRAGPDHVERVGRRARQVDDAAARERATVVQAHDDALAVLEVRHAHPGRQRQRRMGAGHRVHVVGFAGRRAPAVEIRAVPRCNALLDVAHGARQHDIALPIHFVERRVAVLRTRLVAGNALANGACACGRSRRRGRSRRWGRRRAQRLARATREREERERAACGAHPVHEAGAAGAATGAVDGIRASMRRPRSFTARA